MAESLHLLMFWGCFVLTQVKFYILKDCGYNRGKGLSVGFNTLLLSRQLHRPRIFYVY